MIKIVKIVGRANEVQVLVMMIQIKVRLGRNEELKTAEALVNVLKN